jgi:hypothetical protein
MRRSGIHVVILTFLLAAFVVPSAIATTYREEETFTTFGCDDAITSGRTWMYLYGAGTSTGIGGPFVDAELSVGRSYFYPADGAGTGTVVDNGDGTISVDVANPMIGSRTGGIEGVLEVHATLATVGDWYPVSEREHSPGWGYSVSGTVQDLALISGTATFGSTTLTLPETCSGRRGTIAYSENYPNASNDRGTYRYISCELDDGHGTTAYVDAYQEGDYTEMYVFITISRRSFVEGYTDLASFTDTALSGSLSLDGDATGTATVAATLTPIGTSTTTTYYFEDGYEKYTRALSSVAGSLDVALDDGQAFSFDMAGCDAAETDYVYRSTDPSGPKPGPIPSNDLPAGAIAIAPGASISVDTQAAAAAAEEDSCAPLGRSVWYTAAGSGATMTLDTTGTLFDTMVAVYTKTSKGFKLVTCVDDVDSSTPYQAIASWGTKSRTTYWIQVGGFDGQSGTLEAALT